MQAAAAAPQPYCLQPVPQSQLVLPCLLRRLLQQGDHKGAQLLALHHQRGPHFSRSLEWLLFTALDRDYCALSSAGSTPAAASANGHAAAQPTELPSAAHALARGPSQSALQGGLLQAAFNLVRRFEQWRDVVVNVSRKTDATMWPLLFAVVGKPSAQLRQLLQSGQVRAPVRLLHAACCIALPNTLLPDVAPRSGHALG